jgi:hypothetical protein
LPSSFLIRLTSSGGDLDVTGDAPHATARLVLEQVPAVALLAHQLACAGDPEPPFRTAVRLIFGMAAVS